MSWNQFNNQYAGQALNYGNFDGGLNRPNRANAYTMVQTMIADRMMAELSCSIVMTDMNKASANRLLFAGVTLTDTPTSNEAAILADDQESAQVAAEGRPADDRRGSPAHLRSLQGRVDGSCNRTGAPDGLCLQQQQRPELHRSLVGSRHRLHDWRRRFLFN